MQWVVAALALGLASSFHCIGMCGPLILSFSLQTSSGSRYKWVAQLFYFLGKSFAYGLMGFALASVSQTLIVLVGQRIFSILSSLLLIVVWILLLQSDRYKLFAKWSAYLQQKWSTFYTTKKSSQFIVGFFNGLLPCHMVFVAASVAFASNDIGTGFVFMFMFGLGTVPALVLFNYFGLRLVSKTKSVRYVTNIATILTIAILLGRGAIAFTEHAGHSPITICKSK